MCMDCGCSTPNDKKVTVMVNGKTKTTGAPSIPTAKPGRTKWR